jgi:hypothetical protein
MRCLCPRCCQLVRKAENVEGLQYCRTCRRLFIVPPQPSVPPWILGVLVVLTANWQIVCRS